LVAVILLGAGVLWWLFKHPDLAQTVLNKSSPGTAPKAPVQAERGAPADKPAGKSITSATETIKDLGTQIGTPKPTTPESGPQFDVARIEPNGDSVIAGRAAPNAKVELLRDGEVHDETAADATGAFVLVPKPLPPGKYELKLRTTEPGGKSTVSTQSVAVELGAPSQDKAVAAITPAPAAPQKSVAATDTPSASQTKPAPAPVQEVKPDVRIDLAEAQEGGKLLVTGRAAPGANIRLYLNDSFIASGTASADGQVSFFIGGGVKPGEYRIRLDQVGPSDKVIARAEVPFNAPTTIASAPATGGPVSSGPASSAPPPATPSAPAASTSPPAAVAAAQPPQPAAQAPTAAAAPPASTPDSKSQPQSPPTAASSQPAASETKPAAPSQVAMAPAPAPRAETGAPAGTSAPRSPAQREAAPAMPQTEPASKAATAPRSVQDTTPSATPPAGAGSAANDAGTTPNASPSQKSVVATGRGNTVIIPNIDTRVVIRGDNLWQISRTTYGRGIRYTVIYKANRDQIRDPDLIYPGQIFVLPKARP
jgi:hypothetical protein